MIRTWENRQVVVLGNRKYNYGTRSLKRQEDEIQKRGGNFNNNLASGISNIGEKRKRENCASCTLSIIMMKLSKI